MPTVISNWSVRHLQRPFLLWTGLRGLGNSPLVKATIAVPLVGYVIIFNQWLLGALAHWDASFTSLTAHASTCAVQGFVGPLSRLYLLYYGLTALAAGALFFRACPPIVRENATDAEYVARRKILYSDYTLPLFLEELRQLADWLDKDQHVVPAGEKMLLRSQLAAIDHADIQRIQEHHLGQLMATDFSIQNHMRPFWRAATALAFYFGFALLTVPALDMFLRVTATLGC